MKFETKKIGNKGYGFPVIYPKPTPSVQYRKPMYEIEYGTINIDIAQILQFIKDENIINYSLELSKDGSDYEGYDNIKAVVTLLYTETEESTSYKQRLELWTKNELEVQEWLKNNQALVKMFEEHKKLKVEKDKETHKKRLESQKKSIEKALEKLNKQLEGK